MLCELNVDTMLLNNFSEMLETVQNDTPGGDETCQKKDILQNLLTELIIQLHKETFKALNFKIFIGFIKKDSQIPLSLIRPLLETLNMSIYQCVTSSLEPSTYLEFSHATTPIVPKGEDDKYMAGNGKEHKDANPKEDETSLEHSSEQCFASAWNSSALTFKLPYSTAEPMFSLHSKTAMTISTWMYWDFHSPSNSNEWNRFHIFSVGSKSLLLECWIDNATIQVRVASSI